MAEKCPPGLGRGGRKLWRETILRFDLEPWERPALAEACRMADELAALRAALAADGQAIVKGSMGQDTGNPLYGEIRAHAALVHKLLPSIGVDDSGGAEACPLIFGAACCACTVVRLMAARKGHRPGAYQQLRTEY